LHSVSAAPTAGAASLVQAGSFAIVLAGVVAAIAA
jgi:hypothetical protein